MDWASYKVPSAHLANIVKSFGYEFDGHRALHDALAVLWLMHFKHTAFFVLVNLSRRGFTRIRLPLLPSEYNDSVKKLRYMFNTPLNMWEKTVTWDKGDVELATLKIATQGRYNHAVTDKLSAFDAFR